ncbi:glycosyltransferase family 9 protein [Flavobacterium hiemivividum]|uniref:Lipopolysaccharide heptosyltransferase family protein n=1 Tax=Flavobacterium hiemivividum TaxID=2541734 RepID=A0A4R5CSI0_9FLAO|nr:glycosyltransferase family 9 protein [Flavobacterium hiemivividum]TDE03559.1 lipopolysaccharide heptosyltransferase family protein [Flavobacterium hiemivividum]
MSLKTNINALRRQLMRKLTKNVGTSQFDKNVDLSKVKFKKILICRPNPRLGNQLLITPLVQDVIATFPDCEIDLFVNGGLAPIIFENYTNINRIIRLPRKPFKEITKYVKGWLSLKKYSYDIVINVVENSSSGRLSAQFVNSKYKFFGDDVDAIQQKHNDYEHIAKYPVYNFRHYLTKLGFKENNSAVPNLDLKLSDSELAEAKKILQSIVPNDKKTIAIFTFATADKCYSEAWWAPFYDLLLAEYPDYNIIEVLPVENVSQIGFKAPTFYSKDVREIGALIANTEVFIGADSGIMHLASASKTPTVGLFSRDNIKMYQPYNDKSVAIDTNTESVEDFITAINKILR